MAKPTPVTHVLVLVDGTESAFAAATKGVEMARALDAKLTALAVVDTETLRQLLSVKILVDTEMGEFEEELKESARRQLTDVRERALDAKIVIDEILEVGNVETVVPRVVQDAGVDLICLGAFQVSKVTRDLVARQRQQIIDRALCPVLIVK